MNIAELFISQVKNTPKKLALVENSKSITYVALFKSVKKTASYFKVKGITQGDKVLIAIPISIETYRVVLALFYIGAIPVFMEEWAFKNNFYNNTKSLNCKAVIVAKKFRLIAFFSKAIRSIPIKLSITKLGSETIKISDFEPNHPALFSFTSGSSGEPKIAIRSHEFLKEQFRVLSTVTNATGDENVCCGLAIVVLFYLGQGNTIVLRNNKMLTNVHLLNSCFEEFKVNQIVDSPAKLLSYSEGVNKKNANQITHIFTGGGPVFPNDAEKLNLKFSNSVNSIIYGSTEVEPISVVDSKLIIEANSKNEKGLCVGSVNSDLDLKIIKTDNTERIFSSLPEFENICLRDGVVGEVVVKGKHVLETYYNSEVIFKKQKIEVGTELWHKTGDSGYVKKGILYLTGPCNSLIDTGGKLLSPFIIENKLRAIDGVEKGTVIEVDKKIIVVVEGVLSVDKLDVVVSEFLKFDQIIKINNITMDVRHQTKINYIELKNIIITKKLLH